MKEKCKRPRYPDKIQISAGSVFTRNVKKNSDTRFQIQVFINKWVPVCFLNKLLHSGVYFLFIHFTKKRMLKCTGCKYKKHLTHNSILMHNAKGFVLNRQLSKVYLQGQHYFCVHVKLLFFFCFFCFFFVFCFLYRRCCHIPWKSGRSHLRARDQIRYVCLKFL